MENKALEQKNERYYHIDFFRFVFAAIIVYYHILHSNIIPYTNGMQAYADLAGLCNYASNIVAIFFIISGVFLYRSYEKNANRQSVFEYILGRVVRLAPVLIFAIVLESVLNKDFNFERNIINMFFLQCSGLSLEYKGILWYVSSFFFVSIFYYALLSNTSKKKALLLISILTYLSFVFRINYSNGSIGGRETVLYVINLGVLRAIGDMGWGILLAVIYKKLHFMKTVTAQKKNSLVVTGLSWIAEIASLIWLFDYFLRSTRVKNHILLIIIFSVLLLIMLSSSSLTRKLLNRKFFGALGKYAYSIYVVQQSSFILMRKTLWLNAELIAIPWIALSVSTLCSVIFGIMAYYMIEKPCAGLYSKWHNTYLTKCREMQ